VLPVRFLLVDNHVGVIDARTGRLALRYEEVQRLLREEAAARIKADQARQRAEQAQQQETEARLRAERGQQQAEQSRQLEAQARAAAEAETARLRAEVDRLLRGE